MAISPWQLIIILLIVVLIFGTKKLRNVGKDLGGAVHDFKKGLNDGTAESQNKTEQNNTIEHRETDKTN